jgi:hypothetical protein
VKEKGGVNVNDRETDYVQLLNAYRQLWSNRSLRLKHGEETNKEAQDLLYEAVKKDLLDEMTHPRVRQSPDIKLQWGIERIKNGDLEQKMKDELVSFYHSIYNEL